MAKPEDPIQRSVLPIPDVTPIGLTTFDAKDPDTKYPPIRPIHPPAGAPNVLVILIDDAGYGSASAFGGPCQTPNFEKLAAGGLRYTRFHTTALCSPTRAALLSGRNHHTVGMGAITEFATSAPGQNSMKPNTCAALAETLKLNGYSTAQFGKCHEVPVWESSAIGPFDHWPTGGGGFQYFYGFVGGETHQYYPNLFEGTTRVEPRKTPEQGYTLNEPTTPSTGSVSRRRWRPTGRFSSTTRRVPRTRRITCPRSGPTSTEASSIRGGINFARRRSRARRSSA
jgi:arylsulfatase A-like enzyme